MIQNYINWEKKQIDLELPIVELHEKIKVETNSILKR